MGVSASAEDQSSNDLNKGHNQLRITQGVIPNEDIEKFEEIEYETNFTHEEVKKIMAEFGSKNYEEGLTKSSFGEVAARLNLFKNTNLPRDSAIDVFFRMFDSDHNGVVNFEEFVRGMAIVMKGTVEQKAELLFRVHDLDCDGQISKMELFLSLKKSLKTACEMRNAQLKNTGKLLHNSDFNYMQIQPTDDQINKIVDDIFIKADKNHDKLISQSEFVAWVKSSPDMAREFKLYGL